MTSAQDKADPFTQLVEDLGRLDDTTLLAAWAENAADLDAIGLRPGELKRRDQLRQRHYAFRLVVIRRFGTVEHADRYQAKLPEGLADPF